MRFATFLLIILLTACVDRIEFELGAGSSPVVVHGFISDEPGPYTVEVSRAVESDDKLNVRKWISVKRMILSDSEGASEQLTEVQTGIYKTSPGGIQGKVGNAYTLRVEMFDGKFYESVPDTLLPAGEMEDVYFNFKEQKVAGATEYGFDIFFNSSAGNSDRLRYIWKLVATYQVTTNPEQHVKKVGEGFAPDPRPCSGYVVGSDGTLQQVGPCECCTCWVSQFDGLPIVSDLLIKEGSYKDVKIGHVPLDTWLLQHKVHAEVRQQSLGRTAYA
ncbi:MAG TPA: DUF4249 family protein, partial [Chryseosolibacter sp.]|nr:DUF4249 family protein [Chryseosolibacter sp.]